MKMEPPTAGSAARAAPPASPPSFRALRQMVDDVEALSVRHGSVAAACARLEALERANTALEVHVAALKQKLRVAASERLSPAQAVEILQRRCTCVGDVSILGALLAESLRSAGAEGASVSESADVRVILSVHEVNLTASTVSSASTASDRSSTNKDRTSAPVDASASKEARQQAGRPRKRQRRLSDLVEAAEGMTPVDNAAAEPHSLNQSEGVVNVDESDTEPLLAEASAITTEISPVVSTSEAPSSSIEALTTTDTSGTTDAATESPCATGAASSTTTSAEAVTGSDDTDAEPVPAPAVLRAVTAPKEPGRVESRVSAVGVITRNWKLPRGAIYAANKCRRRVPTLTIDCFQQLDAARPWDLVFFRRSNVSYVFHYRLLKSKAKRWVRAARWFQFQFRRELWEWMHWITMDERRECPEWELYRRCRDERSVGALTAWWKLHDDAMELIADKALPSDVWLDPAIWFMRPEQRLIWKPDAADLVKEQAKEDLHYPVRCYYVGRRHDHPFFGSEFQTKYAEKHNLPLLISADRQHEVQIAPPISSSSDATAAIASIPCPTPWGTTEEAPRYRVVRHHRRPRDTTARANPPPPESADFSA